MEELRFIIAENISSLRRDAHITQAELASRLNYSDKAISKWERGESVPDIGVLKNIADIFGVSVDYLLVSEHPIETVPSNLNRHTKRNRILITAMSIVLVWLIATTAFIETDFLGLTPMGNWLTFIYAVPVSATLWLIFNSIWFNPRRNFMIISILMWSVLTSVILTAFVFGYHIWLFFILGAPAQAIIILWSGIRTKKQKKKK